MTDVPKIYRLVIQVSDLDRAAAFYERLLGVGGRRIYGSRHYFDCGAVILALLDPTSEEAGAKARPNPDHVYFSVKDLEAVHERATGLGCLSMGDVHGEPAGQIAKRPWGERSFYAADPVGNPLCFVAESTVYTGK
jgi:predicted enzyme related to lactoylglutathione lyase